MADESLLDRVVRGFLSHPDTATLSPEYRELWLEHLRELFAPDKVKDLTPEDEEVLVEAYSQPPVEFETGVTILFGKPLELLKQRFGRKSAPSSTASDSPEAGEPTS